MAGDWPQCPECSMTLVYITGERVFSCGCGYSRKIPEYLRAVGITQSDLDLDITDVRKEGEK